jgi:hypothetical protein
VRQTIADSRFPFSGEIRTLRAALEKLEPQTIKPGRGATVAVGGPMVDSRRKARC